MRRLAPVALLVLALAAPATAHAHASLKHVTPATQSRVETPPRTVRLQFDQSVTITPDAIDVFTSDGKKVSGIASTSIGNRVVTAPVRGLKRGEAYTVRWRATSSDGHTSAGRVHVRHRRHAAAADRGVRSRRALSWTDDVARWAYFVSLVAAARHTGTAAARPSRPVARSLSMPGSAPSQPAPASRRSTSASQPS